MNKTIYRIMGIIVAFVVALGGFFNVEATSSLPAASSRPVYAYYYLWWSTQHWYEKLGPNYPYSASPLPLPAWTDADGCNAASFYPGNQLVDVPTRLISQDEPGAIEEDIRLAKHAGIHGFWLNWNGDGTTTQTRTTVTYTRRLAEAFAASARIGGFSNWVSYKAASMPPAYVIINDLNFLYNEFKNEPAWERIDGKPVVTFTGSRKYSDADVFMISSAVRDRMYLVGDESRTTLTDARIAMFDAITYYWSSQDPYRNPQSFDQIREMGNKVHAAGKKWYAPLNPGYNSGLLNSDSCVPRRNGHTLRLIWNGNLASNPDGWGLVSWNEIAENSHIKPMQKWGRLYLDVLASMNDPLASTWYINGQGSYVFGTRGDIAVPADYNGDGRADMGVFRPSKNLWSLYGIGDVLFGGSGDIPVVADYNGDRRADVAIFRPSDSTWYISGIGSFHFGTKGDIPVVADYNGDRRADIAVFRPSNGTWYINGVGSYVYGGKGDIPVVADYSGDGKADIAVFRPSNSTWYVNGVGAFLFGGEGDTPVVADYNGDGKADIAVFRPSNSTWYVNGVGAFLFGGGNDVPVVADYNGDRKADIGISRPASGE